MEDLVPVGLSGMVGGRGRGVAKSVVAGQSGVVCTRASGVARDANVGTVSRRFRPRVSIGEGVAE